MTDENLLEEQVAFLYRATAKGLYNLAFYTIQNQSVAERLSMNAFTFAFYQLSDKTDVAQFRIFSAGKLYRSIKKTFFFPSWHAACKRMAHENSSFMEESEQSPIAVLLTGLRFDERFLLLLFLQQKFSQEQIAKILCVPRFVAKKRLCRTLGKAADIWSQINKYECKGKPV